jgi:hypothetical protein
MSIFFNQLPIYYINLEERKDRDNLIIDQINKYKIKDFTRINAISKKDICEEKYEMSKQELACSKSHMLALKHFLLTDKEFALICEDDVDLSNCEKINFNLLDIFTENKNNLICIQTSIATRKEIDIDFNLHKRSFWDFGTMSYIINKKYAKTLIDFYFINNEESFYNFKSKKIQDFRGGEIETRPVADELIYSLTDTYAIPLFTYMIVESDVGSSEEYYSQFIKGRMDFINYWSKYNKIEKNIFKDIL